jgi:hypothetical protein
VTRSGIIRGALLDRGLSETELRRGWDLYSTALGFGGGSPAATTPAAIAAAGALAELDAWDAPNFSAAQATLEHRTPAAYRYLFDGLRPSTGPDAVVGVQRFIDRVTALREAAVPSVPTAEATEAVNLLATRKILAPEIETRLLNWIAQVTSGAAPVPVREDTGRGASFNAYRNWLHEWREVARTTFTRRDYRIALGLAERKGGEEPELPESATAPST